MISLHFSQKSARWGMLFCVSFVLLGLCLLSVSPRPVLASDGPGTGPGGVGATDGTSNLRLWLKAGTGVYQDFVCSQPAVNGTVVACWKDQSGNGNNATQLDSAYYPVYRSTPAIQFNGITATLSSTPVQLFAESDSGLMAIVVFNTSDRSGPGYLLNHSAANGESLDNNFELGYGVGAGDTVGNFGLHRGSSHATIAPTDTITNNTFAILSTRVLTTGTLPADSVQIYKNGVSLTLDISGAGWLTAGQYATSTVPLDIGARRDGNDAAYPNVAPDAHHAGDMVEIILYTAPLNTAQRIIIENYLSAKYEVPLAAGVKYGWTTYKYTQDVAGIGREADGMHTEANSAGLILVDNGFLQDSGDYVLVGHKTSTNGITTGDLAKINGVASRWGRIWQLDRTDVNEGDGVTLKFDFDDAGIAETPEGIYTLLYRSLSLGNFGDAFQASSHIVQNQVIFSDVTGLINGYYTLGKFEETGYDLFDSNQPGGPVYAFENITDTGTLISFDSVEHQITGTIPINFSFNFYGEDYAELYVGMDGFLTFLSGQAAGELKVPSVSGPNGLIAGWWESLYPYKGGAVHYKVEGSSPDRRFILQFTDVPQARVGSDTNPVTFQIKLFETSNIIEVHYKNAAADGGYHSAGIENQTGDQGLQYYYARGALADRAVRYVPRPLLLNKAVNVTTPRVGERITYTLRVHSNLTTATTDTVISDTLDAGLIFATDAITITPAQSFDLSIVGQTLVASNFSLLAGEKVTLTVPVTVDVTVQPGVHLVNTATVTHPVLAQLLQDNVSIVADNCWANVDGAVFDNVQTAVDAADEGDLVKVAGYCMDVEARENLEQTLYLSKTLTLRGGYASVINGTSYTVTDWVSYDAAAHPTILDAQAQGRVIYVGAGVSLTLEGLRLTGGDASAGGAVDFGAVNGALGGGLFAYSATVTMGDTLVYGNGAGSGGGIYVYTGTFVLEDSEIFSNTATDGGGVYLNDTRSVTMSETAILSNTATSRGGGMRLDGVRHFASVQNLIRGNTAVEGGGLYFFQGTALVTDLMVLSNRASDAGGGFYVNGGSAQIRALTVMSNTSTKYGGGFYLLDSGATIEGITVTYNFAGNAGGGYVAASHNAVLTDTYIAYNTASSAGGGCFLNGSNATLWGNRILSNTATNNYGGGLYLNGGAPTLYVNTIASNVAKGRGGGIYAESSHAVLSGNRIEANSISGSSGVPNPGGGGMHIYKGTPLLSGNEFLSNIIAGKGGGLFLRETGAIFSGNVIALNIAASGGGAYLYNSSGLTFRDNTFRDNTVSADGGGLYAESGTATLEGNTFSSNYASDEGGAAYLRTNLTLTRNRFEDNEAYKGGGLYVSGFSTLDGNIVSHNEALLSGGGLYMDGGAATLINNVVASNVVSDGYGSGLYINASTLKLLHTTVALNTGGDASGAYVTGASQATFTNTILVSQTMGLGVMSGSTVILHSVLRYGNTTDWGGGGTVTVQGVNIRQSPDFVDPDNDDFHLNINSPAIDMGVDSGVTVDMDGNARPRNAGYDLGADEYDGTCFARLNDMDYFYATIQEAVDASTSAADVVKVAGMCAGVQNRSGMTQTVYIDKSLTIRGGYTLTDWSTSNPIFNPTTLDAQGAGRVFYVTDGADVALEALHITGGAAVTGGGVHADDVSLTLSKVWLTGNSAGRGGAVYLDAGNATLVNAMIVENQASQYGGGLYSRASSPVLLHTTFARNTGGGIYVTDDGAVDSTAALTNTILVSHTVGITVTAGNTVTLNATLWGSGIWSNGVDSDGAGTVYSATNYTGDPGFIAPDALNYHINAMSAALNQAIDIGVDDDVDGDERPFGGGYDLGADEFAASFVVTKRASPDPVLAGAPVLYTIDVVNTGALDLVATIRDTLPDHVTPGGERVWADVPIAAFGGDWTTQFAVTVDANYNGVLTNTGVVTTLLGVTRYFTEPVTVNAEVDLSITKAANVSEASAGQPVTYTLSYLNAGPSIAYDVIITDVIPGTLGGLSVSHSGAAITPTGGVNYVWEVEPLAQNEGGTIIVTGVLDAGFAGGFVFTNTATISSTTPDRMLDNNVSAPVTITVLNTRPVAQDDTATTDEDIPVTIPVLDNDDDADGDPLTVTAVSIPTNGSATTNGETIVYTPTLNFYGTDIFTYTVGDGRGGYDIAWVSVTVSSINDPPEANDDILITNQNRTKEVDVLGNDQDVEGESLTIIAVGTPGHGAASTNGLTVIYTPTTDFFGNDSFTYTISDGELTASASVAVTVLEGPNQPPVAVDDVVSTPEGMAVIIQVLDNDSDPELDILSIVGVGTPAHGTASIAGVVTLIYTPTTGFVGNDSFDYTISDGEWTVSALVTVTVYSAVNWPPVARDDIVGTYEGTPVTIPALDNDTDPNGDALSLIATDTPSNGVVSIVGDTVVYTPTSGFTGLDSFDYTVSDGDLTGSAQIIVIVLSDSNTPPQATDDVGALLEDGNLTLDVLLNDTDDDSPLLFIGHVGTPLHGLAENQVYSITYTPSPNFSGMDTFTYTVSDGEYNVEASVTVVITAVNDAPTFIPGIDPVTVAEDAGPQALGAWATGITPGPADEAGQALAFTLIHAASELFAVQPALDVASGDLTFTPAPDANGSVLITAVLQDDGGTANGGVDTFTETFTLVITPVEDAPRFTSAPMMAAGVDAVYTYAVTATDADAGDTLTITASVKPAWLALSGSGGNATLTGTPSESDIGQHAVTLEVRDTTGLTDTQSFSITVDVAPELVAVMPADGAQQVALTAPVVITFSEEIDASTFAFTVTPDPGGWVVDWSPDGTAVTLDHTPFASATDYTVTLTAAHNVDGISMVTLPYSWSFRTAPAGYGIYIPLVLRNSP